MTEDSSQSDLAGKRTLATIVFTDVASFSARMNEDESGTLRLVNRDFTLMRDLCQKHQGRVLKSMGDGLLMYFDSAAQAVGCALEIQTTIGDLAKKSPSTKSLQHRIGIHIGDVYVNESDVMGDGVNIASRLESKAAPGGICISQTVYDVVKNSLKLDTTFLGPIELKNIREKVPVYRLLLEAQEGDGDGVGVEGEKKKLPPIAIAGIAAAVLLIAGIAAFFSMSGPEEVEAPTQIAARPSPPPATQTQAETTVEQPAVATAGQAETAAATEPAADAPAAPSQDSLLMQDLMQKLDTVLNQQAEAQTQPAAEAPAPVQTAPPPEPQEPQLDPKRIYVAIFENLTGDPAEKKLGNVVCDTIAQGLEETKLVSVVPATINRAATASIIDDGAASGSVVGQAFQAGAGIAIYGSYFWQTYDLKIQAKIIDVDTGSVLNSLEPVSGPLMSPRQVVDELKQRVATAVALHFSPYHYLQQATKSWPPRYDSYQAYQRGMEHFGHGEYNDAIDDFNTSLNTDREFLTSTVMKAVSLINLDKVQQGVGILEDLKKAGDRLNKLDQTYIDFALSSIKGDILGSYRTAQTLAELEPNYGNAINAGLRALWLNRPNDAIDIFNKADPKGRKSPLDAYAYLLHAEALHLIGENEQALEVAKKGVEEFSFNIIALTAEAIAYAELGMVTEAGQRVSSSYRYQSLGSFSTGRLILETAKALTAKGETDAATNLLVQALDWYEGRPEDEAKKDTHRFQYAEVLYRAGKFDKAMEIFSELSREYPGYPVARGYVGLCAAQQAATAEALAVLDEMRKDDYEDAYGWNAYMGARIAAVMGNGEQAQNLLQRAFTENFPNEENWNLNDLRREEDFLAIRDSEGFQNMLRPKG